jgi:hypothetical protein
MRLEPRTCDAQCDFSAKLPCMPPTRGPRYNRPYEDEPGVIEQFRPGECQVRFEAEWNDEKGDWIFGKRVDDA